MNPDGCPSSEEFVLPPEGETKSHDERFEKIALVKIRNAMTPIRLESEAKVGCAGTWGVQVSTQSVEAGSRQGRGSSSNGTG